jgi:chromosome segregation ATPase
LESDLREREEQSIELARENEAMKGQVSALQDAAAAAKLERRGDDDDVDAEKLREENKALATSVEDMEREVSTLREDNSKLKVKADKGHELLFESNSSYNQLKENVESLKKEKTEAVLSAEKGEALSREMQQQLSAKGEELEKALEMVAEMKEHLEGTHERNQELESTCARMKAELETSNNNLGLELKEREKEVLEMNELLKRLKASTDQVEELKGQLIQVKSDYTTQQTLAQSKDQAQAELQSEIDTLRQQLEAGNVSNTQNAEMSDELEKAKQEVEENKLASASKDSTIERLTLKVSQNEVLIQELEKKSASLQESNREYEKLTSQLEGNISKLDARMKEDAGKMEELNQLTSKMTQFSNEAAEAESLREFIKEQKIQFQDQQQALREEANAKEAKARALTTLITDLHALASRLS